MAISLKKGQKVSLKKASPSASLGEILVNLNWNSHPKNESKGFFASLFGGGSKGIDLDLGCLYELKSGRKGAVQALGNSFGTLAAPPFVALDGDDRTGDAAGGENLRVNGDKLAEIRRVLIYTFIYEGVANWADADATVTIRYPGQEEIIVKMDDFNTRETMCALVLLENQNDETFGVEKLVRFFRGHEEMDRAYNWGIRWVAGSKD